LIEFYESIICSLQEASQSNSSAQDLVNLLQIADLRIETIYFALKNLLYDQQSKIFTFVCWLYLILFN